MIEILAEFAAMYFFREIPIRRGNHPHIQWMRRCAADALKFTLLQHSQQLCLQGGASSPTSSRKMVPPWASSNRPRFSAMRR